MKIKIDKEFRRAVKVLRENNFTDGRLISWFGQDAVEYITGCPYKTVSGDCSVSKKVCNIKSVYKKCRIFTKAVRRFTLPETEESKRQVEDLKRIIDERRGKEK